MIEFKIVGGRVYGKVGMTTKGQLVVQKGIQLSTKAVEAFKSIYTQCIMDNVVKGVISVEDEMVDKTLMIYEVYGATGDNGKDY